jgi:hypothetical protein
MPARLTQMCIRRVPFRLRIATHPTQWSIEPLRCTALHVLHCALHAANLSDLHVWEAAAAAAWGASVMPALRRDILAVVHVRPCLLLSVLGVLSRTATSALRRSWHDIPGGTCAAYSCSTAQMLQMGGTVALWRTVLGLPTIPSDAGPPALFSSSPWAPDALWARRFAVCYEARQRADARTTNCPSHAGAFG